MGGFILQGNAANPVLTSSPLEHRPAAHWPAPPCQEGPSGPLTFCTNQISGVLCEVIEQAETRRREPGDVYPGLSLRYFGEPVCSLQNCSSTEGPQIPLLGLAEVHIADLVPNLMLVCKRVH